MSSQQAGGGDDETMRTRDLLVGVCGWKRVAGKGQGPRNCRGRAGAHHTSGPTDTGRGWHARSWPNGNEARLAGK